MTARSHSDDGGMGTKCAGPRREIQTLQSCEAPAPCSGPLRKSVQDVASRGRAETRGLCWTGKRCLRLCHPGRLCLPKSFTGATLGVLSLSVLFVLDLERFVLARHWFVTSASAVFSGAERCADISPDLHHTDYVLSPLARQTDLSKTARVLD